MLTVVVLAPAWITLLYPDDDDGDHDEDLQRHTTTITTPSTSSTRNTSSIVMYCHPLCILLDAFSCA